MIRLLVLSLACGLCLGSPVEMETDAISKDVNDLQFFYYPSTAQKVEISYNNKNSLESSNIRSATKTLVIIDGFLSDSTSPASLAIRDTYIRRGNQNVIILDWGKLSGSGLTLGNPLVTANAYLTALGNVGPTGRRVAEFLEFLRANKNIQFRDVTIIGHSLGAHIAGAAGNFVQTLYGGLVGEIVGLDPAGPFFSMQVDKDKRLHKADASFVIIYHTNRGTLGDSDHDTGHVNVYVNGGKDQPGCEEADKDGFAGYCSHSYSWQIFVASAAQSIKACPCNGDSACTCTTCSYTCDNSIPLGPDTNPNSRGRYHVTHGPLA